MFGQRVLIENVSKLSDVNERGMSDNKNILSPVNFIRRLCKQGKQISQIIVYIWLWADEDVNKFPEQVNTAIRLKQYFDKPIQKEGDQIFIQNLEKLLRADPKKWLNSSDQDKEDVPDKEEAKLLINVFGEKRIMDVDGQFPIFSEEETEHYIVTINVNSFQGTLADPDVNTNKLMKFQIPYPPAPKIGNTTVTKKELQDWVDNTKKDVFFADSPYIPTTCS